MKRFFVAIATLFASVVAVQAQTPSGLLLNRDIIPASSLLSLSQREYVGTARSMGMGGAFTSLGADMASFGCNPAGFGMYQRNEVSASFGLGIAHAKNSYAYSTSSNNSVRVAINNVGASFKVYEGTGKLLAVNLAIGYNKVADYNYSFAYEGPTTGSSLAGAFADIANAGDGKSSLGKNSNGKITDPNGYTDYDMDPYFWGAAMAYKGYLIDLGSNGWYPSEIAEGANIRQLTNLKSRGSAGEFSFAVGFNIDNIIYLGASLDIQSISRKQTIYYNEYIGYSDNQRPNPAQYPYLLQNFEFGQTMAIDGSGVGAKFGIVVRPIEALRIGFAVHTPTFYSVTYRYSASLYTEALSIGDNPGGGQLENGIVYSDQATPTLRDGGDHRWKFTTPTRLLAGISYTIGRYAIVSVDYQYDAYRSMKLKYSPAYTGYTNSTFRNSLKGVHSLRVGVEAKALPWLSLRVGGGFKSSVLDDNYNFVAFSEPMADRLWYASAGLGFRLSKMVSLDLAYQYRNTHYSNYRSYYTQYKENVPNASPLYGLDMLNHNIALTLAFRF